jgi:serine phosphatase RsbU (regulator of sigma subunit)
LLADLSGVAFEKAKAGALQRTLASGDVLVLYSDGVTDAESPDGAPFDEEGLERVIEARRDGARSLRGGARRGQLPRP